MKKGERVKTTNLIIVLVFIAAVLVGLYFVLNQAKEEYKGYAIKKTAAEQVGKVLDVVNSPTKGIEELFD